MSALFHSYLCARKASEWLIIMRKVQCYFSPTGGTRRVAELLVRGWGSQADAWEAVDLSKPGEAEKIGALSVGDVCIAAVPVFGGRIPAPAAAALRKLCGNGARAVAAAVYGNRAYEDALLELKDALEEAGFCCIAGITAVAQHSIIHEVAAGRPDARDEEQLAGFAAAVRALLEKGRPGVLRVPGNRPYKEYRVSSMAPRTTEACIKCGQCAGTCPVGAIPPDAPNTTDAAACISCMRCVAVCPQKARYIEAPLRETLAGKLAKACPARKDNELFLAEQAGPVD